MSTSNETQAPDTLTDNTVPGFDEHVADSAAALKELRRELKREDGGAFIGLPPAEVTRADRERAADCIINGNPITRDDETELERWFSGECYEPVIDLPARFPRFAQAIATARAEGEAKGRDEALAREVRHLDIVDRLCRAMRTWGSEEDGVPESGPVGQAYDVAVAHLKEFGR